MRNFFALAVLLLSSLPLRAQVVANGNRDFQGTVQYSADLSPAQIVANQNDYNPAGLSTAAVLRLSTDASRNITGLQGGADGRMLLVYNVGSFNIVLTDEDILSAAANRFAFGANVTLAAKQSITLQYDSTSSRWRSAGAWIGGGSTGVPSPSANGMVACTGIACSTSAARTITGTTNEVSVTNGDGVAGNPTLSLPATVDLGGKTSLTVPKAAGAAPTAQGDERYDTTQDTFKQGGSGGITGAVPRVLATFICNSTVCTCTGTGCTTGTFTTNCISGGADASCTNAGTTETNFGMNFSVPANFFIANKMLRVTWGGEMTSSATSPSWRTRMKLGSVVLYDTDAQFDGDSLTARGQGMSLIIQGTAAPGASVNLETMKFAGSGRTPWGGSVDNLVAQPVAVATNAAQTLQFSLQLGAATIGNFFRTRWMIVEALN